MKKSSKDKKRTTKSSNALRRIFVIRQKVGGVDNKQNNCYGHSTVHHNKTREKTMATHGQQNVAVASHDNIALRIILHDKGRNLTKEVVVCHEATIWL
ncbi:MAG: hypothetical protein Q8R07_00835, partial [Candidatus Uhrbacteria bacterium]|nr:hypothetical protein [Candidatus Uhrbacteria bacterium]